MDVRGMWRFAVISLLLLGCGGEEEECPYSTSFDCGRADDWWRPPHHASIASFDKVTLVCFQSEWDSSCRNAEGDCCCGGVLIENQVRTPIEPAECSKGCTGLDEATCALDVNCFVARAQTTNTYLGCYWTEADSYTSACASHSSADTCARGFNCIAVYTPTGTDAWQYTACVDP
jgi:hypothetical protein